MSPGPLKRPRAQTPRGPVAEDLAHNRRPRAQGPPLDRQVLRRPSRPRRAAPTWLVAARGVARAATLAAVELHYCVMPGFSPSVHEFFDHCRERDLVDSPEVSLQEFLERRIEVIEFGKIENISPWLCQIEYR